MDRVVPGVSLRVKHDEIDVVALVRKGFVMQLPRNPFGLVAYKGRGGRSDYIDQG